LDDSQYDESEPADGDSDKGNHKQQPKVAIWVETTVFSKYPNEIAAQVAEPRRFVHLAIDPVDYRELNYPADKD
jgi:hypothetical protein